MARARLPARVRLVDRLYRVCVAPAQRAPRGRHQLRVCKPDPRGADRGGALWRAARLDDRGGQHLDRRRRHACAIAAIAPRSGARTRHT